MRVREFFAKIAPFLEKVPAELSADANVNLPEIMDSDILSIEVGYSNERQPAKYHLNITIFPVIDQAKVTLGELDEGSNGRPPESETIKVLPA